MATQEHSALHISQSAIRLGRLVPNFVLPSASGGQYGPGALRSKYNMVIAFLGAGRDAEAYLSALAESCPRILEEQARVIAVAKLSSPQAAELKRRLSLPYAVLADGDGALTARMLGGAGLAALVVADRFSEVFCLETAPSASELPSTRTAIEWLEYIQVQCPE
jgi:peroxiredoxin